MPKDTFKGPYNIRTHAKGPYNISTHIYKGPHKDAKGHLGFKGQRSVEGSSDETVGEARGASVIYQYVCCLY